MALFPLFLHRPPWPDPPIYIGPEGIVALRERIKALEELGSLPLVVDYWRQELQELIDREEDKLSAEQKSIRSRRVFMHDIGKRMGLVYPEPVPRPRRAAEVEII